MKRVPLPISRDEWLQLREAAGRQLLCRGARGLLLVPQWARFGWQPGLSLAAPPGGHPATCTCLTSLPMSQGDGQGPVFSICPHSHEVWGFLPRLLQTEPQAINIKQVSCDLPSRLPCLEALKSRRYSRTIKKVKYNTRSGTRIRKLRSHPPLPWRTSLCLCYLISKKRTINMELNICQLLLSNMYLEKEIECENVKGKIFSGVVRFGKFSRGGRE